MTHWSYLCRLIVTNIYHVTFQICLGWTEQPDICAFITGCTGKVYHSPCSLGKGGWVTSIQEATIILSEDTQIYKNLGGNIYSTFDSAFLAVVGWSLSKWQMRGIWTYRLVCSQYRCKHPRSNTVSNRTLGHCLIPFNYRPARLYILWWSTFKANKEITRRF